MYPIVSIRYNFFSQYDVKIAKDILTDSEKHHKLLNPKNGELNIA